MEYELWAKSLRELVRDVPWPTANLANAAALLYQNLPDVSWAGFYLTEEGEATIADPHAAPEAPADGSFIQFQDGPGKTDRN